ncbi:hypothetical protein [Microbulbifer sp. PSTR4-B]|uniref:hypothetical protein n=1 Tax=Microbulbifer sp. PSTR4-B TaxID=3243396 RepID=UPI0040394D5C
MGGKSKSRSSQQTSQNEQTWNFVEGTGDGDRLNLGLSEGARVGDISISKTDYGAIGSAERMTRIAFDTATEMNRGSRDLGLTAIEETIGAANNFAARSFDAMEDGFDFARDTNRDSLDFAERSQAESYSFARETNSKSMDFARESLDFARDANTDSLDFASNTMAMSIAAITKDADASRKQTADQIDRAFTLATMHSRSEGAEAMDKTVKVLGWGGAAFASIAVLAMFRGK